MNETGPLATPWVVFTTSPRGRRREKEKPVPPPDWWMSAAHLSASKIAARSSSTGNTKQAASWPPARPAFMSVGELGRNSRAAIRASNRSAQAARVASGSASATARATRRKRPSGLSIGSPPASRRR